MKIAVVGLGGVGGYFGGKLARAYAGSAGHRVIFIARGQHLAAIQKAGLVLKTAEGEYRAAPDLATQNPTEAGVSKFLGVLGLPAAIGRSYGSVMMIVLAITIMQLVVRFMRVATSELLSDVSPIFRNPHVGTFVASVLGITLVLTGWWQYLWVLFGGANQLMASLALMLITAWLMSEGKSYAWTLYPMIFMFITTVAALLYTSYNLLAKVFAGGVTGEAFVGNLLMGVVGFFLVICALILGYEGFMAFKRLSVVKAAGAPAKA